ncbi:thymidine kinase [Flavobacteriaceae bacterium]|jgi:thymidine kinase|nr:thymidine kinase [Flavobacteriaceae bacterium]MDC3246055.1 thymidine kinase [Flavobacteriaceae bacterium]
MDNKHIFKGRIEVICGSMFSGKTEELIRRIKKVELADEIYIVFRPKIDSRNPENKIISHAKNEISASIVSSPKEILDLSVNYPVIGIDEAQFFDQSIVDVSNLLANRGHRLIIAGLDMDFEGNPFGPMPNLMACAEDVMKVHAVCMETGNPAGYSYRKDNSDDLVLIGEKKEYKPLSREAFVKKMVKRNKK